MELLYIWIEESSNGFIKKQGFNLYGEHKFWIEEKNDKYELHYSRVDVIGSNLFEGTNIKNITAIVGENGSGKSTILNEVLKYGMARNSKNEKHNEKSLISIKIFKKEDDSIIVYDNFEDGKLVMAEGVDFERCSVKQLEDYRQTKEEVEYANAQTKVYFTNGENEGARSFGNDINIFTSLSISNKGLDSILKSINYRNKNEIKDLQAILDLCYYSEIRNSEKYDFIKPCTNIYLYISEKEEIKELRRKGGGLSRKEEYVLEIADIKTKNIIEELYKYLLCEIYLNTKQENTLVENINIRIDFKKTSWDAIEKINEENKSNFKMAYEEIKRLSSIIGEGNDIFKRHTCSKLLNGNENKDELLNVCEFVKESLLNNYSFVLGLLMVEGFEMSSGERAMQNFLSRINMLPDFKKIISEKYANMSKNLLVLIDEIDLYIHPEWQRKILNYLVEELGKNFDGYDIQIIITTHSPFVLSDLPKENVIYLKPVNGEFGRTESKTNTFASNIYTLLNDSFFMESTIGEFAKGKIEKINEEITNNIETNKLIDEKEYREIRLIINAIGEPVIRSVLEKKLSESAKEKEKRGEIIDAIEKSKVDKRKIIEELEEALKQELELKKGIERENTYIKVGAKEYD